MNCENCQELLSDWLDNELAPSPRIDIGAHLAACPPCRTVHDELNSILGLCVARRGNYDAVPNEEALWRRISNTIEAEQTADARASAQTAPAANWRTRFWNANWQLSRPQLTGSLAAIALLATTLTLGMAKLPGAVHSLVNGRAATSLAATGNRLESIVQSQQPKLDYWLQRVEQRKARWSPQLRQNFEYNLNVLDQAVKESSDALNATPHDPVSEERLSVVLEDKKELLQEFASR